MKSLSLILNSKLKTSMKIYIAYHISSKESAILNMLKGHLLTQTKNISHKQKNRGISRVQIKRELNKTDIVILGVSASFFKDEDCQYELKLASDLYKKRKIQLFVVAFLPVNEFAIEQKIKFTIPCLPLKNEKLTFISGGKFSNQEEACMQTFEQLLKLFKNVKQHEKLEVEEKNNQFIQPDTSTNIYNYNGDYFNEVNNSTVANKSSIHDSFTQDQQLKKGKSFLTKIVSDITAVIKSFFVGN